MITANEVRDRYLVRLKAEAHDTSCPWMLGLRLYDKRGGVERVVIVEGGDIDVAEIDLLEWEWTKRLCAVLDDAVRQEAGKR